jgi:hypothetical protein
MIGFILKHSKAPNPIAPSHSSLEVFSFISIYENMSPAHSYRGNIEVEGCSNDSLRRVAGYA